jgi:flagellar biosynthesis protein FlhB
VAGFRTIATIRRIPGRSPRVLQLEGIQPGEIAMNPIDTYARFFGWCTVINVCIYLVVVGAFLVFKGLVLRINARAFSISEQEAGRLSMQYMGLYKLAITVFCFAPYLALRIMS